MNNKRIMIVGGPRTGKTTLADEIRLDMEPDVLVYHTDDLIGKYDWADVPDQIITWMQYNPPWLIEGVQTARALRRWLKKAKTLGWAGTPCDRIIVLREPKEELTKGQTTMMRGVWTVWKEVEPQLDPRVVVEYR